MQIPRTEAIDAAFKGKKGHYQAIDASTKGNKSRFMNSSCQPNCKAQAWLVDGVNRVGIFATRDIEPHEDLTFAYNFDAGEERECHCGFAECSGTLGSVQSPNKKSAARAASGRTKLDSSPGAAWADESAGSAASQLAPRPARAQRRLSIGAASASTRASPVSSLPRLSAEAVTETARSTVGTKKRSSPPADAGKSAKLAKKTAAVDAVP
jgi:hypothetical protein